jgi:ribonuclease E
VPIDVATYLLNEKRNEVLSVETRFKVNVLLVPNRHLETPNYTVERLRHDDLNQSEPLPPSFDMVVQPEQLDPAKQMKEEAKEPRQEAVVKGITPAQPAPLAREPEAPARPGLFKKILGWLRGTAEDVPAKLPVKKDKFRTERPPRSGQERREPRQEGRGGERRDRRPQDQQARSGGAPRERAPQEGQAAAAPAQGQSQQGRRDRPQGQQPRGPRSQQQRGPRPEGQRAEGPRQERPAAAPAPAGEETAAIEAGGPPRTGEQQDSRRRRGGRNRQRGERGERGERPSTDAAMSATEHTMPEALTHEPPPARPEPPHELPVITEPLAMTEAPQMPAMAQMEGQTTRHETAPPPEAQPALVEAPSPRIEPPPVVAPLPEPAPQPRAQRQPEPPVPAEPPKPYVLPSDSGLVMVETRGDRPSTAPLPASEPTPPPRTRRERPVVVAEPEEPLVMVETRKE